MARQQYAALLGSINVGGNRLKMAELKIDLASRGYENVQTVAASGNVLFYSEAVSEGELQERIEQALREAFGIDTFAAIRTKHDLITAAESSPFAAGDNDNLVHVMFLACDPASEKFDKLILDHSERGNERLALGSRALHIDYVDGVGRSKLTGDFISRRLGCRGTARNLRSIKRIIEKFD